MNAISSVGGADSAPFGGSGSVPVGGLGSGPVVGGADRGHPVDPWAAAHTSVEFHILRKRLHGFVFPMTALFLSWYFLYVLLAAFAPHLMAIKLMGNINIGLVFGLLQFVSTFAITTVYVRFANRDLDPLGSRIRQRLEGGRW
jgi:uncharacterized membrane protein (DUF485 family)